MLKWKVSLIFCVKESEESKRKKIEEIEKKIREHFKEKHERPHRPTLRGDDSKQNNAKAPKEPKIN